MKPYVYKPKRAGKRSAIYSGRFKDPISGKIRSKVLDTTDRQVAEKRLRDLVSLLEREQAGLPVLQGLWGSEQIHLDDKIGAYECSLKGQGRTSKHIRDTVNRIRKLFAETFWETLEDITPSAFEKWRSNQKASAKTQNEYLASVRAFLRWLEYSEGISCKALEHVKPVSTKGRQKRQRRAWTEVELKTFFEHKPFYYLAVLIAVRTGLRKSEIQSLQWGDFVLEGENPHLILRGYTTKSGKNAVLPLAADLVEELLKNRPERFIASTPILDYRIPRPNGRWKKDLKEMGLHYCDDMGRYIDFHSLRHTFVTMCGKVSTSQRVVQALARHSDPNLTANIYTDTSQLDLRQTINQLPSLTGEKCTLNSTLKSDFSGQNGSFPVTEGQNKEKSQVLVIGQVIPPQSLAGTLGRWWERLELNHVREINQFTYSEQFTELSPWGCTLNRTQKLQLGRIFALWSHLSALERERVLETVEDLASFALESQKSSTATNGSGQGPEPVRQEEGSVVGIAGGSKGGGNEPPFHGNGKKGGNA